MIMTVRDNPMRTAAHKIDAHIGGRVRVRRIGLGLTQDDLARKLDLSYQQLQKYEAGHNRVSGGRLWQLSKILHVDTRYFFEGVDEDAELFPIEHGGRERSALEVVKNFKRISDPGVKAAAAGLIKALVRI